MESNLKANRFFLFIGFISILIMSASLWIEYFGNLQPCFLCQLQRLPYILAILLSFLGIFMQRKEGIFKMLMVIFSIGFFLSAYHILIQQEFLSDPCKTQVVKTVEDFQKILIGKTACKNSIDLIIGIHPSWFNFALSISILIALFVYPAHDFNVFDIYNRD